MAKDTFYFSHDYNARNDDKIKALLRKHKWHGYGLFWAIIEDLYNNANALRTDYEGIAYELRTDEETIRSIVNDFGFFEVDGDKFGSISIEKRLDERNAKSKTARENAHSRWEKVRENANVSKKNAGASKIDTDAQEDDAGVTKNDAINKGNKIKEINIAFDVFWELYDKKVGEKNKLKKKWENLKDDEREKAIEHIKKYKESQPDKKYRKDPQTYLNNKSFNDEIIMSNGVPIKQETKVEEKEYWERHYGHLYKTKEEFMEAVSRGEIDY